MFTKTHEVKKHSAWSIFMGVMSAALAVFLIVHPLRQRPRPRNAKYFSPARYLIQREVERFPFGKQNMRHKQGGTNVYTELN